MNFQVLRWLQISLFNLMLVAFIGIVLRYKIAFSLPFIDQKYLLHGHSHFAFAGWLTQVLMTLLVSYLSHNGIGGAFRKYRFLLYSNLLTAYGMLISFPLQGYGLVSIIFSTLSVIVSYLFAVVFWKDLNGLPVKDNSQNWFKAAVAFNALSSIGVFSLAFMMATKSVQQNSYLAAVYFYLHFQYNGWFFFACMGLLCSQLTSYKVDSIKLKWVYRMFLYACVPAYLLSTLWATMPTWVYILIVAAVFLQIGGWVLLLRLIYQQKVALKNTVEVIARRILLLSGIALTIKLCLQAGSVIPFLSKLAFGFRPIVIGYLHLVLLVILSLYIIGYILAMGYIPVTKIVVAGITIFVAGVLFNETLLMIQGIAGINYQGVPLVEYFLFAAAIIIFTGLVLINRGIKEQIPGK